MESGTIYCLENTENGMMYVGATTRYETRLWEHRSLNGGCPALTEAIEAHGWNAFAVKVVETLPETELETAERFWIDFLNTQAPNGYNLTPGGDVNPQHVPEIRERTSATVRAQAARGELFMQTPEGRALARESVKNMHTPEAYAKRASAVRETIARGEWHSQQDEWKAHSSELQREKGARGEHQTQTPEARENISTGSKCGRANKRLERWNDAGQQFLTDMPKVTT